MDIFDLGGSGTDDLGKSHAKTVKMEPGFINRSLPLKQYHTDMSKQQKSRGQYSEDDRSSSALSTGQSGTTVIDQEQSPVDDSNLCSSSSICAAPVCRQFWKAGNYNDVLTPKSSYKNGSSYLHIHPKFLHSNATSHKWAFGAIAELLDNAVDEVQNGATFVIVDKATNPRNGSPALLIQDDGGGMDPDAMRRCLSFGFSDKKSNLAIGQYGNGFKTSSMRLGADVIVFSRHMVNRKLTQSIGLLSYTFLTRTGHDRIVVPMVDYVFNTSTNSFDPLQEENYSTNLSVLLHWSPYSTEEELLLQFDDVGAHGTKVIVYNLWFIDEGSMELDFESDPEDIRIAGEGKSNFKDSSKMAVSEKHIANRLRYSLRAYLSVLYLKLPETFCILLRGQVIEYHNIATDLKYTEFILYKPQIGGCAERQVVTTIGFLKEAPNVNVHGFNVYHKNRLILPFWPVVSYSDSRGRGVVGVLEANFIEPTHSKQDFEKTSVFQKLEARLKEMTWEYWDYHCGLIGYQIKKKAQAPPPSDGSSTFTHKHGTLQPVGLRRGSSAVSRTKAAPTVGVFNTEAARSSTNPQVRQGESMASFHINPQEGVQLKRKERDQCKELEVVKRKSSLGTSIIDIDPVEIQPFITKELEDQEAINVIEENKRLREQCMDYEKTEKHLEVMVNQLRSELEEAQGMYTRMLAELRLLENVKEETDVQRT